MYFFFWFFIHLMDFVRKVERKVLEDGGVTKVPHLLENFSLSGLNIPFQAGIIFHEKNHGQFSFGIRCPEAAFKRNEPFLWAQGLVLTIKYEITGFYSQQCAPMRLLGTTQMGCPWQDLQKLPASAPFFILAMRIALPDNFMIEYIQRQLAQDFYHLDVSKAFTTITVLVKDDNKHLPAYRELIMARCPQYRNDTASKKMMPIDTLDWRNYSYEAASFLLQFLYTARYDAPLSSVETRLEVVLLANELQLFPLALSQATYILKSTLDATDKGNIQKVGNLFCRSDPDALNSTGQVGQLLLRSILVP